MSIPDTCKMQSTNISTLMNIHRQIHRASQSLHQHHEKYSIDL